MKIRIVQPVPVEKHHGLVVGLELEAEEALDELPEGRDIGSMRKRRFLKSRDGFWVRSPATNEPVRLFAHEAEVVSP